MAPKHKCANAHFGKIVLTASALRESQACAGWPLSDPAGGIALA